MILKLMHLCYFIAKENLSFCKYNSLIELTEILGVNYGISKYQNRFALSSFLKAISDSIFIRLLEKIRNSSTFGIMVDETTDISTKQQLIIYCTYWNQIEQRPCYSYFKTIEIKDKTSTSLLNSLRSILSINNLSVMDMMGFASDGAKNMTGIENGLAKKLSELNPFLISTHCVAHRLNLASQKAFEDCSDLIRFEETMRSIYTFFSRSPKRYNQLENFQNLTKEPLLKLVGPCETRWSALYNSIRRVSKSYKSLLLVFNKEQKENPTARFCIQFKMILSLNINNLDLRRLIKQIRIFL